MKGTTEGEEIDMGPLPVKPIMCDLVTGLNLRSRSPCGFHALYSHTVVYKYTIAQHCTVHIIFISEPFTDPLCPVKEQLLL